MLLKVAVMISETPFFTENFGTLHANVFFFLPVQLILVNWCQFVNWYKVFLKCYGLGFREYFNKFLHVLNDTCSLHIVIIKLCS